MSRATRTTSSRTTDRLDALRCSCGLRAALLKRYRGVTTNTLRQRVRQASAASSVGFRSRLELVLELHNTHMSAIQRRAHTRMHQPPNMTPRLSQSVRSVFIRALRRKRNRPVNTQCPILMEALQEPVFRYVTQGTSPRVYAYNLEPLLRSVITSARFADPMTGVAFTELEVWRLAKMRDRHMPRLFPDVDLVKLAFDEEYRSAHALLTSIQDLTHDHASRTLGDMLDALDPNNATRVVSRYITRLSDDMRLHMNTYSLLNGEQAVAFMVSAISRLRDHPRCPPTIVSWAENVHHALVRRQEQGAYLSIDGSNSFQP
jgi:hypothetical protein